MSSFFVFSSLIAALGTAQPDETPDSLRVLRAARRAQQDFEATRRANLPWQFGGGRGPCDLQVGRFCYWHEGDTYVPPPPEPARIASARERLLQILSDAAREIAGDDWVIGQYVRYLVEADRPFDAVDALASCRATAWWCNALSGLALHVAEDFVRADSAFSRALAAMSADQRCRWTDISLYLDGDAAKTYSRASCTARDAINDRFWWLSDPLLSRPGNDARTEFYSRRTMSRLEQHARSAYNVSWGTDVDELLIRFGWPTSWTREQSTLPATMTTPSIIGREPAPSFYFHPKARLLELDPAAASSDDWQLDARLPPARYAPTYATRFLPLQAQVAAFRRADSTIVVAAFAAPSDTAFAAGVGVSALALARDEFDAPIVRSHQSGTGPAAILAAARATSLLASVEVTSPDGQTIARTRFGIGHGDRTSRVRLSDLLLYRPRPTPPTTLEGAATAALPDAHVPRGGTVGVYWETYGLRPRGELISVALTVTRTNVGWLTKAAQALGVAGKSAPLRVRWQEVPQRGVAQRAITVDLSSMPAGSYRLRLTAAATDESEAISERVIEIVDRR